MPVQISLATGHDDAAIRRLCAANAVPGTITVSFEREPNYFLGCETMGRECQVLVARRRGHGAGDEIVGAACRATRPVFINGEMSEAGYLGQLRVDRQFRGRWLVSRGFRLLRELHDQWPMPGYLVSVIEGNREALGVLIHHRRRHFPDFYEMGRLCTLALTVGGMRPMASALPSGIDITRAGAGDVPAIVGFLGRHGAAKQFYPAYTESDFEGDTAMLGFRVNDFVVARRGGRIAGVLGLWDQSSYKQTVVRGHTGWLRAVRPFYDLAARLRSRPTLPRLGEKIRYAYASFACVAGNDPAIFRPLLRSVYNLAAERGYSYLMIGLHERDPLLTVARRYSHIAYHSRLFLADFEHGGQFHEQLDGRVPYVEIAAL